MTDRSDPASDGGPTDEPTPQGNGDEPTGFGDGAPNLESGATVLLAMDRTENRRRLVSWLPEDVVVRRLENGSVPSGVDLCVVDDASFGHHVEAIDEARETADPTFLPVLLVISRDLDRVDTDVWNHVNDVIEVPVRSQELRGRIEVLLRARRASLDAESRRERLEEAASILAHDLRNPLAVATGFLEQTRRTGDLGHLDRVEAALHRIDAIIGNVLTLARHGKQALDLVPVNASHVVEAAWGTVGTEAATLENRFEPKASLRADAGHLREALENLFRNAVEHGAEEGTVVVGPLPDGPGFFVADDGPGIPPEDRESVFEFGQTSEDYGTGLGLAIVERIAHAHDWKVRVTESAEGGARFEVVGPEVDHEDVIGRE